MISKIPSLQSITNGAKTAQDLADEAMRQTDTTERAKTIEGLFDVLESEQNADGLLNPGA